VTSENNGVTILQINTVTSGTTRRDIV